MDFAVDDDNALAAQNITDHGNRWTNAQFTMSGTGSYAQSIGADTLVNGLIFRKLLSTHDSEMNNWFFYNDLVREENGKVYHKNSWTVNPEGDVIIDFGLDVGDSLAFADQYCMVQVIEVDSVELENGIWKKRLHLGYIQSDISTKDSFIWIEGVGTNYGQFRSLMSCSVFTEEASIPLCFHSNDELLYTFPVELFTENCWYIGTNIEDLASTSIQLYPNPAHEFIYLIDDEQQVKAVSIYNSAGKEVYSSLEPLIGRIEISHFVAGSYFVLLKLESDTYSTRILKM